MRNLFLCLFIGFLSFGLVVNDASAKRFGGGRSFGVQRSKSSLFSSRPSPNATHWKQQANNKRKWGGILGGLLAGSLLTSLFMGHGLGSGLLSWLIIGSLVFFLINFFRKRMQPGFQTASTNHFRQNQANFYTSQTVSSNSPSAYPAGFIPDAFLREAKVKFIRLQAAYDQKNLQDLQDFTAPEVFAEIKMQIDERGNGLNKTEVINLNAQLLDVSKQADSMIASVRFTGSIKEDDHPITSLDEIWHFRQFYNNDDWVVGGIQQEVFEPL
ncbi:Tim44 domain-containing protein [Legionella fairfieldensis]|uniref:Tim44 domain-containing protein n=1 Tax=Legionella fairfieldensis TaxID=45064 RepID=UPI00048B58A2|nr:Tim44-like domain-containing protein [Legionella fairfieldensis]